MAKRTGANARLKRAGRSRRAQTRSRASLLIGALATAAVAGCVWFFAGNDRLHALARIHPSFRSRPEMAQQVVIQGAVQVNPAELLKRSGMVFPVSMDQLTNVYLSALKSASPWIEKIKVVGMQGKNGTVVLGICERKPVAMLMTGSLRRSGVCLVDSDGVCLSLGIKTAHDLPLVSGLADSTGGDGVCRLVSTAAARMNRFLKNAAAYDGTFAKRISQVNFGCAGTPVVRIMLTGSATVLVINEDDYAGCMQKYVSLRETLRGDSLEPARIDLAYRNLAFVTPETVPQPSGAGESIAKKNKG